MKIFPLILPVIIASLILTAASAATAAPHTGSWGDQGNGTYRNPILESNYPDNDVIRVGDTFYMMSSTNHLTPGMTILKSKDLVNWEFSGPIMPAPITFDPDFNRESKITITSHATWAGSFGYDGTHYHAYWCHNKRRGPSGSHHIMHATAKNMEGPWSQPQEITWANGQAINSTDPGVMWDLETKRAWLACDGGDIYEMSWDGTRLLQNRHEGIVVAPPQLRGESAKLYKFDGMYYLMNTHAFPGKDVREQVISRARKMEGPWESRVVLENGNGTDRCPSQGTLLKLDDGSWWFVHQLARGRPEVRYNGRPQFLEPVTWRDGWPMIGVDTNGNGIGEVVWEYRKPINGFPVTAPASDDDFSRPTLGAQWNWVLNPRMDRWSLTERPGFLRLKACVAGPHSDPESIKSLPNIIGQRLMGHHRNVMTAKIDFTGLVVGQEGGLHISAGDNNIIGVRRSPSGKLQLFFKSDAGKKKSMAVTPGATLEQPAVWFRATVEEGIANFFYSLDGRTFTPLGHEVRLLLAGFTPNLVGFYSMNTEEKGYLDVDWFTYDYDGPKGNKTMSSAFNPTDSLFR